MEFDDTYWQRRYYILNKVREIAFMHLQGMEVQLYLFGSWARKEERQSSDIDLAIYYTKPLPADVLPMLRIAFEESNLPYRVELIDLTKTSMEFQEKVRREGIVWTDCSSD